jgi:subtilase family serine protease
VHKRFISLAAGSATVIATALAAGGTAAGGAAAVAATVPLPVPLAQAIPNSQFAKPPTTAQCVKQLGVACYSPAQFQKAYNLAPLYKKRLTGKGQTIVIVDSFGYQFIRGELAAFDKAFKLPAPPKFTVIQPAGKVPAFNPKKRPTMAGWAQETSLDVEYSHAMAPGANILLVETPVAETLGRTGFPAIVKAENFVISHHLGNVISQSFAAPEVGFGSKAAILSLRSSFKNAQANAVSVLTASGDAGATGAKTLDSQGFAKTFFLNREVNWPASDPLVTAIGGTQLHLSASGAHTSPDSVWNDTALLKSPAASTGGKSTVFARPVYQDGVAGLTGSARGVPDISMSAAVNGSALVYLDAKAGGGQAGFYLIGGTSEASPEFAGIIAIADQAAGHGLGLLNPALYAMEAASAPGIVDVTSGNNSVTFKQGGAVHTVHGFRAKPGYDLTTGIGTINAALFVPELVAATGTGAAPH